jgi:hypothetical protein
MGSLQFAQLMQAARSSPDPALREHDETNPPTIAVCDGLPRPEPSMEFSKMRKMLILLALAVLTASNIGCTRCRNLFRRGSPCSSASCGTTMAAPAMLGGAIPMGNPVRLQPAPQLVQPNIMAAPPCCQQAAPICVPCNPCPTECVPCEPGCIDAGADCGCPTSTGEYFGGYVEGSGSTPIYEGNVVEGNAAQGSVVPQGSSTYPQPTN